jgi:hypothetical protein
VSPLNPDDDGSYWLSAFDFSAPDGSSNPQGAQGVLARLTLKAIASGAVTSPANLDFTYGQVKDSQGNPIPYTMPSIPAAIAVNQVCQLDYDHDGVVDDLDNCPVTANPNQEDVDHDQIGDHCEDSDNDGFIDHEELYMNTDWADNCPDNSTDDAWPLDITKDKTIRMDDVLNFAGRLKAKVGDQNYSNRLDFSADGVIRMDDVLRYAGKLKETCT